MAVLRSYSYLAPSMVGRYEAGQAYLAAHGRVFGSAADAQDDMPPVA
jgi:hypothetical protein